MLALESAVPRRRRHDLLDEGVAGRDLLHALVAAELHRVPREPGGLELALVQFGRAGARQMRRWARAAFEAAGHRRFAVANYEPGVLALLAAPGGGSARARIAAALVAIANVRSPAAIGVAALGGEVPGLEAAALERVADLARSRALAASRHIERIEVTRELFSRISAAGAEADRPAG